MNIYFVGESRMFEDNVSTSTIIECLEYIKDKDVLGLDIETSFKFGGKYEGEGLDPYLSTICMLQIGDKERQYVIDTRVIDVLPLLEYVVRNNTLLVGHNIKFEYKHIFHNYNIRLTNVYDTMVVEQILFNGKAGLSMSLKALNERYLNIVVDKSTRNEFAHIKSKPFTMRQIKYGAEDIINPLLIREKQLDDIDFKDVMNCVQLEMKFLLVLGDIEYKGMCFNQDVWTATYDDNLIKFNEAKEKLDNFVLNNFPKSPFINRQLDMFNTTISTNIQWTSSKQVIELFKYMGICPMEVSKTTKKLSYTVDAKVVRASLNTSNVHESDETKQFIKDYLSFKELEQCCTTFGIKFFKHINPITNRVHSNYKQILNTGRISSSGPNLQNIPASEGFRKAFDCPDGFNIINADYSGQEQIILANKSNDPELQYFYEQNLGDMHKIIVHVKLGEFRKTPFHRTILSQAYSVKTI